MRITIINGVPDDRYEAFEGAIGQTVEKLKQNHNVDYFIVREMDINHCVGCFACWRKTPGRCAIKDDMEQILSSEAKADFILYISPVVAGFISSAMKKVQDRSIPVLLPYIRIIEDECHHPKRYDNQADSGLIALDDGMLDEQAVGIVFDVFDRNAINMHAKKVVKKTATLQTIGGIIDEIGRY